MEKEKEENTPFNRLQKREVLGLKHLTSKCLWS